MSQRKRENDIVVVDIGAGSGRVFSCRLEGMKFEMKEAYRFQHEVYIEGGRTYWDFPFILENALRGIKMAAGEKPVSVAVDSWAPDFCFLKEADGTFGRMLAYKDPGLGGALQPVLKTMSAERIFAVTGNNPIGFSILPQLVFLRKQGDALDADIKLLPLSSAVQYALTGVPAIDFTVATVSMMFDCGSRAWSGEILESFRIPESMLPGVRDCGEIIGTARGEAARQAGIEGAAVVTVGAHDTALAFLTLGLTAGSSDALINSGTWSVVGVRLDKPAKDGRVMEYGFSNYGLPLGDFALLKVFPGLWYVQELVKQYRKRGEPIEYGDIAAMIENCKAQDRFVIDVEDFSVFEQRDIEKAVREKCRQKYGNVPKGKAEVFRCIYRSIAVKYLEVIQQLEEVTGGSIGAIRLSGGACRDACLCRMVAKICGRKVVAGPVEGTVAGNLLMQCRALGTLRSADEMREAVEASVDFSEYDPA